jgi:ABC-type sugar transport system ATPase subunit
MGLALLPEDRKRQGLVLGLSAAENITLGATRAGGRTGMTSQSPMVRAAAASARGSGFDVARLRQTALGAKQEIYDGLRRLAATGAAVIVVSSELEELAAISDRVFVLSDGRIVAELDRSRGETSVAQILDNALGVNA